ncbi:MAG: hypothetical protein M1308_05285 [Actinobacteria bacterium]|nr:hypothetical protein [Actinomycetota bacterium]
MTVLRPNAEFARFIRKKRSETKKALKKGDLNLKKVLSDNELYKEIISNMKVFELLKSLPGIGRVSADKILKKLKINHCKRMDGLGKSQKKNFLNYFNVEID